MQILTFSSLYPNNVDPSHGIFVERRLQQLVSGGGIHSLVVAPVPWFPFRARIFGEYAAKAAIVKRQNRDGIEVRHPRYPVLPKIGMQCAAGLMSLACRPVVRNCVVEHDVRLIDAHYFYPDGVAASRIARRLGIPYCITARGSDINLIATFAGPRRQMLDAAEGAAALIAVSDALAESMCSIGMPAAKIHVLRNGVDLTFFCPDPIGTSGGKRTPGEPAFISVGALKLAKGHDIAIRFLARLDRGVLAIVGSGEDEAALKSLAASLGLGDRVEFTGTLDAAQLRQRYRSADASILMSEREGMPNVILESLACGTPVMATSVGGIPEILTDSACGRIVPERSANALRNAWLDLQSQGIDSAAIRQFAERFSWQGTIRRLSALMQEIGGKSSSNCLHRIT